MPTPNRYRVLTIDDTPALHEDYRKILGEFTGSMGKLRDLESSLFGDTSRFKRNQVFELESALQGEEGVAKLQAALAQGNPFALAFVDMRMPPGWDGLQTIQELWKVDPELQVVLCTAYSDHTWEDICRRIGNSDNLAILKKPFDSIEVYQLGFALTRKWDLARQLRSRLDNLNQLVAQRTQDLQVANEHLRTQIEQRSASRSEVASPPRLPDAARLCASVGAQVSRVLSAFRAGLALLPPEGDQRALVPQALDQFHRAIQAGDQSARVLTSLNSKSGSVPGPVNLGRLFRDSEFLLRGLLAEGLDLDLQVSEPSPCVMGEEAEFLQFLAALVMLSASGETSPRQLILRVQQVPMQQPTSAQSGGAASVDLVRLTLESQGFALPAQLRRVATQGTRVEGELELVRSILLRHGARVHLQEHPGFGPVLVFDFPATAPRESVPVRVGVPADRNTLGNRPIVQADGPKPTAQY